jgi:hypothetical protein
VTFSPPRTAARHPDPDQGSGPNGTVARDSVSGVGLEVQDGIRGCSWRRRGPARTAITRAGPASRGGVIPAASGMTRHRGHQGRASRWGTVVGATASPSGRRSTWSPRSRRPRGPGDGTTAPPGASWAPRPMVSSRAHGAATAPRAARRRSGSVTRRGRDAASSTVRLRRVGPAGTSEPKASRHQGGALCTVTCRCLVRGSGRPRSLPASTVAGRRRASAAGSPSRRGCWRGSARHEPTRRRTARAPGCCFGALLPKPRRFAAASVIPAQLRRLSGHRSVPQVTTLRMRVIEPPPLGCQQPMGWSEFGPHSHSWPGVVAQPLLSCARPAIGWSKTGVLQAHGCPQRAGRTRGKPKVVTHVCARVRDHRHLRRRDRVLTPSPRPTPPRL